MCPSRWFLIMRSLPTGTKRVRVARAHHLSDNREVASLLMTNQERKEALEEAEPTRESDAERLRKLARMNAVKTILQEDNEKTTTILVYYYHEAACHAEKLVHYLQCQGHSKGLYNQNWTIFTISSKLLVRLPTNFVW